MLNNNLLLQKNFLVRVQWLTSDSHDRTKNVSFLWSNINSSTNDYFFRGKLHYKTVIGQQSFI